MKLLLIGGGGREHALAWKLAQSDKITTIFVAPGNAGTTQEAKCKNVALHTIPELVDFALNEEIDLTVVGPEALLVEGIADAFQEKNLLIFAPNQNAAKLEGSKRFAKDFMSKYGVKTAQYEAFSDYNNALEYLNTCEYPTVVKASGLAAGKGVIICQNNEEAKQALQDIMLQDKFGEAGAEVVIEQFLEGFEASILSICDGTTILPFVSAKDHKKIGEGETGLNTGGMGVVAPNPLFTNTHFQEYVDEIQNPTVKGLQAEGIDFTGVIFFGLMITTSGVYLLEYNTRFGDPETQAVLPLLQSDLVDVMLAACKKNLQTVKLKWEDQHSCCVVAASGGYPGSYEKGKTIDFESMNDAVVFHAGTKSVNSEVTTNGGRVLSVVATGDDLNEARSKAYTEIQKVNFEKMVFRTDIGLVPS